MSAEQFIPIAEIIDKDFPGTCDMCGVCCTHVSINSKMPDGTTFKKPAGETCQYLTEDKLCGVWGNEQKQPSVCRTIKPTNSLCRFDLRDKANGNEDHIKYLKILEELTSTK